jgi:transposase
MPLIISPTKRLHQNPRKLVRRQMYGRGKLDLLRARVLHLA